MLKATPDLNQMGYPVPRVVLCYFLVFVISYLCCIKGIKSSGKVAYVTATTPYILLIVLLVKGLTLDGASTGLKFLFVPNWSKLGDMNAWSFAATQVIYAIGIGFGPMMYLSSASQPKSGVIKPGILIPIAGAMTSLLGAIVLFTYIGYISKQLGQPIEEMPIDGI